eukprot:g3987.t1
MSALALAVGFAGLLACYVSSSVTMSDRLNLEVGWMRAAVVREPLPWLVRRGYGSDRFGCKEWWASGAAERAEAERASFDYGSDDNHISVDAIANLTDAQPRVSIRNLNVPRLHVCELFGRNGDGEPFRKKYDGKKPIIITGATDNWRSFKHWDQEYFSGSKSRYRRHIVNALNFGTRSPLGDYAAAKQGMKKPVDHTKASSEMKEASEPVTVGGRKASDFRTDPAGTYTAKELEALELLLEVQPPRNFSSFHISMEDFAKRKAVGDYLFLDPSLLEKFPELWLEDVSPVPSFLTDDLTPWGQRRADTWGDKSFFWAQKGSRSTVHRDPLGFTSWIAVIRGQKIFRIWDPEVAAEHGMCFNPWDGHHDSSIVDSFYQSEFKTFFDNEMPAQTLPAYEDVVLNEGEIIVTSNWWHQAYNTKAGFSVSGSVINLANVRRVIIETLEGGSTRKMTGIHKLGCNLLRQVRAYHGVGEWRSVLDYIRSHKKGIHAEWVDTTAMAYCGGWPILDEMRVMYDGLTNLNKVYRNYIGWGMKPRSVQVKPVFPGLDTPSAEQRLHNAVRIAELKSTERDDKARHFVLVLIGRENCPWCKWLNDFIHTNSLVKKKLSEEFEVVLVNRGKHSNLPLMADMEKNVKHVPWLIILESSGKHKQKVDSGGSESGSNGDTQSNFLDRVGAVVLSSHRSDVLEEGRGYSVERVMNFLNGHEYMSSENGPKMSGISWRDKARVQDVNVRNDEL